MKDSKLDYSKYHSISLLCNSEKLLKNLYTKDCIPITITTILSIFYIHPLINITGNIRKAIDDANIGSVVFVDLQNSFDIVDHQIILAKLNDCGICGVSNDWFQSYLFNRNQFVSINGYNLVLLLFLALLKFLLQDSFYFCHINDLFLLYK